MIRPRIRWWNSLSVRLIAATSLVAVATIAGVVLLSLQVQQRSLVDEVVRGAALFSDTIKASTYHDMLEDQRDDAYLIMQTIGRQHGVEKVRIFNKEGRVTFSTDRREIGAMVDKRAESCYACHAAGQPIVRLNIPSRSRIYQPNGHRILAMVTPIYNEPTCSNAACHYHPASQRVLGVVDIAISLAEIDQRIAALRRRTLLMGAAALLIIAAVTSYFGRRFVVRPVHRLLVGTRAIAHGNLDQQVVVRRADEIGELTLAFNDMARSLSTAQRDLEALNQSLERQVEERTAALKEAQAQLVQSEKMSSLGKLSASIAHEINNPLAGILTIAKLLLRTHEEGTLDEKARAAAVRNLKLVQRETERCSAIVRNLLDFARQRPLALKRLDVNAPIDEVLSLLGNQMTLQGIEVKKRLGRDLAVTADFGQLRQAFLNIALNASEAMPGGGTLSVSSRLLPDERTIEVALTDTGQGIAPEHLSRILDPFFTTKEKGTGLGLSVVYGIVERHGGKLDIRSEIGKGTTVIIRLPAAGAAEPQAAVTAAGV